VGIPYDHGADIIYYNDYRYKTCNKYEHRKNVINGDEHDVVLAQYNGHHGHLIHPRDIRHIPKGFT